MVQEYIERLYVPAARAAAAVGADSFAGACELATYRSRVSAAWAWVRVTRVDTSGLPDTPELGSQMTVRAAVELSGLQPFDVDVQAVVGRVDDGGELRDTLVVPMHPVGADNAADEAGQRFTASLRLPHAGLLGYTVRVLPKHPLMASPAEFALLRLPS
jgi:starch phosphorylase